MSHDDRVLWRLSGPSGDRCCVMVSCCNGAELQLRVDDEVVLRELYPDQATLYERARDLRLEFQAGASEAVQRSLPE